MYQTVRPGVQIEVSQAPVTVSTRPGIVAFCTPLEFGPMNTSEPIVINQQDDVAQRFDGYNRNIIDIISDMQKLCKEIKIFTTPSSLCAKKDVPVESNKLTLSAMNSGTYGNGLKVKVTANGDAFDVAVTLNGRPREDVRNVRTWDDFNRRSQVIAVEYTNLPPTTTLTAGEHQLTGGTTENLSVGEYTSVLANLQQHRFNVWVTPPFLGSSEADAVENATDKAIYDIRNLDEVLDTYIVTEDINNTANTNVEYKYCLKQTGFTTAWGNRYNTSQAKLILGAQIAGLAPNTSLTNVKLDFAREVLQPMSNRQIESELRSGFTMLYRDENGDVRWVKDQTNYTDLNSTVPHAFTSGLPLRICDAVIMDIKRDYSLNWMGKDPCTPERAKVYRDIVYSMLLDYQKDNYLTNVLPEDVQVEAVDRRTFKLSLGLEPIDATEKLFIDCKVR